MMTNKNIQNTKNYNKKLSNKNKNNLCQNTYKVINKNTHQININKIISNKNIVNLQKLKNIYKNIKKPLLVSSRYNSIDFKNELKNYKNTNSRLNKSNIKNNDHELIFSKFSSKQVIDDLINNSYYKFELTYNILNNIPHTIEIYSKKEKNMKNLIHKIQQLGEQIIRRIEYMNKLTQSNHLPKNIKIYLTQQNKTLIINNINDNHQNKKIYNNKITSESINSAVTDGETIVIFREEECLKCLLHELIHFHGLDKKLHNFYFNNTDVNQIITLIRNTHNINKKDEQRISESFTECLANILNIIINSKDKNLFINSFKKLLRFELNFSIQQISKLLYKLNYKYFNDFLINNNKKPNEIKDNNENNKYKNNKNNLKNILNQSTDVFCYHILKTYLLLNLEDFVNKIVINIINNRNYDDEIIPLVTSSVHKILNKKEYPYKILEKLVNQNLNILRIKYFNKKNNKTKKKLIKVNMRMTCLE